MTSKYYHIVIVLNTKDFTKLSELDKVNKDEVIKDIIKPYLINETFFFADREINKKEIKSIKIYTTDKESKILADLENNKEKDYVGMHWSKEDIVTYEDVYSQDITSEIMKEVQKQLKTNISKQSQENLDLSKVFIVHGHDDGLKIEVCRYLEKLNIKPIILHEQVNKGQTIIEKIESNTNVGFGIALYTSCDIGGKDKENLNNRARQNVVFEHGYLIGKLTRKRVVALVKEDSIETPGDMSGVVYISYNSNWQFDIAKELKSAGYSIDLNKLMEERCIEK